MKKILLLIVTILSSNICLAQGLINKTIDDAKKVSSDNGYTIINEDINEKTILLTVESKGGDLIIEYYAVTESEIILLSVIKPTTDDGFVKTLRLMEQFIRVKENVWHSYTKDGKFIILMEKFENSKYPFFSFQYESN